MAARFRLSTLEQQLEQDIISGKLDTRAQEALADFEAGQYRAI